MKLSELRALPKHNYPITLGVSSVRELVADIDHEIRRVAQTAHGDPVGLSDPAALIDRTLKTYSNFEPRLNEHASRLDYLERQERITLEVFEEQRGLIRGLVEQFKALEARIDDLEWRTEVFMSKVRKAEQK
jgi:hypothetical protein